MTQGIYFHIPFCIRKCPYCDFLSYPIAQHMHHRAELIRAMQRNVSLWKENEIRVDSIFFGGGTPSLFRPEEISSLIDAVDGYLDCCENIEITIEVNPGTVNREYFERINAAGVNRVSIGVQSFCDDTLRAIGRIHSSAQAAEALKDAAAAGMKNISVDFMIGLPGQTMDEIDENISRAVDLGASHISCYDLTISEETAFGELYRRNELDLPGEDFLLDARRGIDERLRALGFERYEISNYAKENCRCLHNLHYWRNESYIGIGPGAVGRVGKIRYQNASDIDCYIMDIAADRQWSKVIEEIDEWDEAFETLMLGTRLKEGVDFKHILTGLTDKEKRRWQRLAKEMIGYGFLKIENSRLIPTEEGWNIQNTWLQRFLKNHDEDLTN